VAFTAPSGPRGPHLKVYDVEERGEWLEATLHDPRCVVLRARIKPGHILDSVTATKGLASVSRAEAAWRVPARTAAYWPDERAAGWSIVEGGLGAPAHRDGDLICWDWPATGSARSLPRRGEGHRLTICHRAEDVEATAREGSGGGGAGDGEAVLVP